MNRQQGGDGGLGRGRGRGRGRGQHEQQDDRSRRPAVPHQAAQQRDQTRSARPQQQQHGSQPQLQGGSQMGGPKPAAWGGAGGDGPRHQQPGGQQSFSRRGVAPDSKTQPVYERPPESSSSAGAIASGRGYSHGVSESGADATKVVKEDSRGGVRGKRPIADTLKTRPKDVISKCGTIGQKITVLANYFRVLKKPNWAIYQYRVDFSPDIDMLIVRKGLLREHQAKFGGHLFDGTVLFSTVHLEKEMKQGVLELMSKLRNGDPVQIKLKYVGVVEISDTQQLQVLNLVLRRAMEGLNLQYVGRNLFDPQAKIVLADFRLEMWPGYITSIRQHEHDVLLCAEIAHKVMRTDSVYSIFNQCARENRDFKEAFKALVCGTVVLTDYNNKTYRVDDVDFTKTPLTTFKYKDRDISFMEYYKTRYNKTILDPRQPLLVSRPTERDVRGGSVDPIILIPELTRATGITDEMRNNFRLMKAMSDHTRLQPDRRMERLRTFNQRLNSSEVSKNVLSSWNMRLDTQLIELPARILNPETIYFGHQGQVRLDERADWTSAFRNNEMYSHKNITNWAVIAPSRTLRDMQEFVQMCQKAANGMRMQISEPVYHRMDDDRQNSYVSAIENAASKDVQLLMVTLMSINAEKYFCVKKRCCVDRPIPSQVVTMRTVAPKNRAGLLSVATKVVIQMNAKLGGAPWMVKIPMPGIMFVGFDVCHSTKDKSKSYGAIVATMDMQSSTRFFSAVMPHLKGVELSNEISMQMTYALKAYRNTHGGLPARIIFFRDGVGDGQLAQVFTTEVENLKKKLNEIYTTAGVEGGCKMAFIVVSKRINTRYFVKGKNPPPGTVVDDVITLPERYDFYLVSQCVRQGTVSPTAYNIISDNSGINAERLQILTYKMTHMYYNWSGTCRVPSVCQYAHKLAFLVAESIGRAPSTQLENQLHFL